MKFSLGGNQGLDVFAAGYPKVEFVACPPSVDGPVESSVAAQQQQLHVQRRLRSVQLRLEDGRAWRGKCARLVLAFADGTTQTALFRFR